MIKVLNIPNTLGFCKKCFRTRREGSSYCGECQDEPERMEVYQDSVLNFPRLSDIILKFGFSMKEINGIVFTYGNVIYADSDMHYDLIAHELTHVFQQMNIGKDIWWGKYFKNEKFRIAQELEAYRQQYKVILAREPERAHIEAQRLANDLSGKLYGWCMPFQEAFDKIVAIDKTAK